MFLQLFFGDFMALEVLLVDMDREWLAKVKQYLKALLYEVEVAQNGKEAQVALYNKKFFAVVVNYDIDNYNIFQVLKFIKNNIPSIKVVITTISKGKSQNGEELDQKFLDRHNITDFYSKDVDLTDLKYILEGHQTLGDVIGKLEKRDGVSEEQEVSTEDSKFTKIKISEFFSGKHVLFDLYVRLTSGRYIKILHAGDSFSQERIKKYRDEKKVEFLYFNNEDRRKYIQFQNHLTSKMMDNKKVPGSMKMSMLRNLGEKFVEEVFSDGVKPQIISQGKEICQTVTKLIEGEKELFKLLRDFQEFDPNAFSHSYCVTLFATSIIKQFEWKSSVTIEATSLACMFHDVGKIQFPQGMIGKNSQEFNDDEMVLYKKHPEAGLAMFNDQRLVTNSVKQIIYQHHENYDGSGFPKGAKGQNILTLANIVHLADDFVVTIIKDKLKPLEGLKILLSDQQKVAHYNSSIIEKFIEVFVDPMKLVKNKPVVQPIHGHAKLLNKKVS